MSEWRTIGAQMQDAAAIWDGSPAPCKSFWLKLKASICIALGREDHSFKWHYEYVPIWASSQHVHYGYDGPQCDWWEVAVAPEWWRWKFIRYANGF